MKRVWLSVLETMGGKTIVPQLALSFYCITVQQTDNLWLTVTDKCLQYLNSIHSVPFFDGNVFELRRHFASSFDKSQCKF